MNIAIKKRTDAPTYKLTVTEGERYATTDVTDDYSPVLIIHLLNKLIKAVQT